LASGISSKLWIVPFSAMRFISSGNKNLLPGDLLEQGMHLDQHVVVQHLAHVGNGEDRFDAAGSVGDDGNGARRSDGGAGGVAQGRLALLLVTAAGKVGEGAPFHSQLPGGGPRRFG
jgi:hypothetical protein